MARSSRSAVVLAVLLVVPAAFIVACNPQRTTLDEVNATLPPVASNALRPVAAFDAFSSSEARSRALFLEASRVMTNARCSNCHPAGDSPMQGDLGRLHDPAVLRGPDNHGVAAMECTSCHQDKNTTLARVPGAPHWALAPREMAWVGRTPKEICEQVRDPARNGGKTLAQIVEHSAHDELVGWGWHPGADRVAAPGDQAAFGALMGAWVSTGALCPKEKAER